MTGDIARIAAERPTLTRLFQMIEDFGKMGTGEFVRKYPDCGSFEGYGYIQRKARATRNHLEGNHKS